MDINKFVHKFFLSNHQKVQLRDKPVFSRKSESHVSEETLALVESKVGFTGTVNEKLRAN
jgi:hypothetical protein